MRKIEIQHLSFLVIGILVTMGSYAQTNPINPPGSYSLGTVKNYVRTWDALGPESNTMNLLNAPIKKVKQATQYFDGIGRPLQTVVKKGSLQTDPSNPISSVNATDMVSTYLYDQFGNEKLKYLPSPSTSSEGFFKSNPFQEQIDFYNAQLAGQAGETNVGPSSLNWAYSITNFEASPLNRTITSFAPGKNWVGSPDPEQPICTEEPGVPPGTMIVNCFPFTHASHANYGHNTTLDVVKIFTVTNNSTIGAWGTYNIGGEYQPGQLYKTISRDENNKQVIEFKDKDGKIILKKVQLTSLPDYGGGRSHSGWLCTYYIYDNLNNLRCVIQPKGVELLVEANWSITVLNFILPEQCFRYEYDEQYRMIVKKIPGADPVYMVYDKRDRLVMTRDGNLSMAPAKWMVIMYDEMNRPVQTGLWINSNDWTYHSTQARNSANYYYPFNEGSIPGSGWEMLTKMHYDDYIGLPAGLSSNYLTTWNNHFTATDNATWPYPQMPVKTAMVNGMVTWAQTKVLNSSPAKYLSSVNIYDDRGRVIQVQSQNISDGVDVVTTQYGWAGMPLINVLRQQIGAALQDHIVVTKMEYDELGRVLAVKKSITTNINIQSVSKSEQEVVRNQYDKLGQLKNKRLAPGYGSTGLENLAYDYNIRGWMLGMNRAYAKDANNDNWFGFDLGYDKANNGIVGGQLYSNPQFNGNIEGMTWKSKGDGEKRKYDFGYDAANRLMKADFTQYTGGTFNQTAGVNFNMKMGDGINPATAYDANGNILQMQQWGLKISGSSQLDNMRYTYISGSNKLKSVTDFNNDVQTKLGDFRTQLTHPQSSTKASLTASSPQASFDNITDYSYDGNGNLVLDNNKAISGIAYNHLNLPSIITVAGKGTIMYIYDAGGSKLKKIATENNITVVHNSIIYTNVSVTTTTSYINGFVYESKSYSEAGLSTLQYADKIQFVGHEEGRIRALYDNSGSPHFLSGYAYDYMIKDHLGNVRAVLTEEQKSNAYPAASMENIADKNDLNDPHNYIPYYSNTDYTATPSWRFPISSITGYPTDNNYPHPNGINNYVAKLKGDGQKIGPAIILKVMAGDQLNLYVSSYYNKPNGSIPATPSPLTELAAALADHIAGVSGGKVTAGELNSNGLSINIANSFLGQHNYSVGSGKPKAYVNWILLDEQFKIAKDPSGNIIASGYSGFDQVGEDEVLKPHNLPLLPINKSGYLYVYVSNETPDIDVFFDNLVVTHTRGPLTEETHYYPFGLTMAGISSKALAFGQPESKRKYNKGSELQNKEFSDGSGLELYATNFRSLDPQLGRWWQIDPKPDYAQSLYSAMSNNPIIYNDPLGDSIKTNLQGIHNGIFTMFAHTKEGRKFLSAYAKKGQTIAGITFKKDGKYHKKGIDLNYASGLLDIGTNGETDKKIDENGRAQISITIDNKSSLLEKGNRASAFIAFFHESFIHADLNAKDFSDNGQFDASNIGQNIKDNLRNNGAGFLFKNHYHHHQVAYDRNNPNSGHLWPAKALDALKEINSKYNFWTTEQELVQRMWDFEGGL